jgi:membrane protein required for colicin V production
LKLLDIIICVILVFGGYNGFKKGLIVEAFSTGAFVVASLVSAKLLDQIVELCSAWQERWGSLLPYVIFVLIFVAIFVVITLLGRFFKYLIKPTLLGSIDRLAGVVVGILKWSIFMSAFIWLGTWLQLKIPDSYTEGTFLFPIIKPLLPKFLSFCASWLHFIQDWLYPTDATKDSV